MTAKAAFEILARPALESCTDPVERVGVYEALAIAARMMRLRHESVAAYNAAKAVRASDKAQLTFSELLGANGL